MLEAVIAGIVMAGRHNEMNVTQLIEKSWTQTQVVGHRGAAAYAPENTLKSFEIALGSGAVMAECDVHMSKDGIPIVMHDNTLDRTTDLTGEVKNWNSVDLIKSGIMTLDKLTDFTKGRIPLIVEIKDGEGVEKTVVDMLKEKKMVSQTVVFSFGAERVKKAKELNPKQYSVWLYGGNPSEISSEVVVNRIRDTKADAVGFAYPYVTAEVVERLHKEKLPVFVWTVPPGDEVTRLQKLKVNFIITNHPTDVVKQLEQSLRAELDM